MTRDTGDSADQVPALLFELFYESLHGRRALVFPCDAQGRVEIDDLSETGRSRYLAARALVGPVYAMPHVRLAGPKPVT